MESSVRFQHGGLEISIANSVCFNLFENASSDKLSALYVLVKTSVLKKKKKEMLLPHYFLKACLQSHTVRLMSYKNRYEVWSQQHRLVQHQQDKHLSQNMQVWKMKLCSNSLNIKPSISGQ